MREVRIVNKSNNNLPCYKTVGSAGMDLSAFLSAEVALEAGERKIIPTGIYIELPDGYEAQIRSRSGLAAKSGVSVLNSPGTIDSDYRGEIGIILVNHSQEKFVVKNGDRIAQMVIAKYEQVGLTQVDDISELETTERGAGGYGSTGV